MSKLLGGCQSLEQATGMPKPRDGCCWSCLSDEPEHMLEVDAEEIADVAPDLPKGGVFTICCAHYSTFEEWRATPPSSETP